MPIIGVTNPGEGDEAARLAFTSGMSTPVSHVIDGSDEIWSEYEIASQPTMVFVAADGTWERSPGAKNPNDLLERTRAMQAGSP